MPGPSSRRIFGNYRGKRGWFHIWIGSVIGERKLYAAFTIAVATVPPMVERAIKLCLICILLAAVPSAAPAIVNTNGTTVSGEEKIEVIRG